MELEEFKEHIKKARNSDNIESRVALGGLDTDTYWNLYKESGTEPKINNK